MYRPTFVPGAYRVRRGPADDSDEEESVIPGRTYARTPFPGYQALGSPHSDTIIPGGRPRCTFFIIIDFSKFLIISMCAHSLVQSQPFTIYARRIWLWQSYW